jgi:hypothetical protein
MMEGGLISNNSVKNISDNAVDIGACGGGIGLHSGSRLEVSEGKIEFNTAFAKGGGASAVGGGVDLQEESVFTFKGGLIRANVCEAISTNGYGASRGGGVNVEDLLSRFFQDGGIISGNSVTHNIINKSYGPAGIYADGSYGGGLSGAPSSISKSNGILYGNSDAMDEDGIPLRNTAQAGNAFFYYWSPAGIAQKPQRNSTSFSTDGIL